MKKLDREEELDLMCLELFSERLKLRLINRKDINNIFEYFTENVATYMYPQPSGQINDIEDFVYRSLKLMKDGSNYQTVIEDKESGEFIGCCGLHALNTQTPEIGVWIKEDSFGNGYGFEAIKELFDFFKDNLDFEYILYPVSPHNIASKRIPENLGFALMPGIKRKQNSVGAYGDMIEYRYYKK